MAKVAIQGGVKNYLPSKEVTVPKKAKSSKNHPTTELAYITEAEKKLLIKKDLHNSLNGKPNRGPGGIISLNGEYDGGPDRSPGNTGNTDSSGNDRNDPSPAPSNNFRETSNITNTTGGPRAKGPSYSVATDSQGNPFTGSGGPDLIDGKPEAEVVRDLIKAQNINNYKPNRFNKFIPGKSILDFIGEKLVTQKSLRNRMAYINSLPPEQKRAMIERLGLAEDDDYDENDMFDTYYNSDFNQDIIGTYGKGVSPLTGDPNQYQGLGSADALALINYDGEYMKQYGPQTLIQNVGGGDKSANILPYPYNVQQPDEGGEEETRYDYRLGDPNANKALDVTLGRYFNQGGRVPRNMGGIMNAVPRQGYFLGGIGKAIGKIGKAAGKVLKSDLGKAAIAGAMFYYGGGGRMPFTKAFNATKGGGFGGFEMSNFFSSKNPLLFSAGKGKNLGSQVFNPFKLSGLFTLGAAAMGPAEQDPSLMATRKDTGLIDPLTKKEGTPASMRENIELAKLEADGDPDKLDALNRAYNNMLFTTKPYENYGIYAAANGGRIGKAEGGLMNLGGMEKDYRAEGGFVPIGKQEKADDVPARLSVNEFVFTADAVRNAGQGDIDKGAEVMENMMKNLENGGTVSEESQGNTGAQNMFSVSERIGEVI